MTLYAAVILILCVVYGHGIQDRWDSIKDNEYFSFEGAMDIIRQVGSSNLHWCMTQSISPFNVIDCTLLVSRSAMAY